MSLYLAMVLSAPLIHCIQDLIGLVNYDIRTLDIEISHVKHIILKYMYVLSTALQF